MKHSFFTFLFFLLINSPLFSQHTILWKITKDGSEQQSYLLGTYHQLGSHFLDSFILTVRVHSQPGDFAWGMRLAFDCRFSPSYIRCCGHNLMAARAAP